MGALIRIGLALFACWLGLEPALAETRVALVIGNGAYANKAVLPNPTNDAEDVAAALRRSNFEVILGTDLGQAQMQELTIRFARAAGKADVAMFYYSGHAMQHNGVNYLMPVDARLDDEADLKRFTRVDDIVSDLQQAKNLRILVLDSCRDNPLAEDLKRSGRTRSGSIGRGLSKMEAPLGTIISFSTQAGRTADDGRGRNSPYTTAFLKHIGEPQEIGEVFRNISGDVYEVSGKAQLPELSLSIVGKFYLNGTVSVETKVGAGSTFTISLPLTLATFPGLLVESLGAVYAVPLSYVQETGQLTPKMVQRIVDKEVINLRGTVMPLLRLSRIKRSQRSAAVKAGTNEDYMVIVKVGERLAAVAVDGLIEQQEVVVKSLGAHAGQTRGVAGASILGDGQVALILDVASLMKAA